ncbi:DEAD/DEAH box helicase [Aureispira anguillae]|uniref:DEAD/DEAH box helicase n=1 Tax=Aureispira anguillae TaxID=2864201 RepID=A0A915YGV8_9BACT|nr:DEAD/DEAH box helicase [Aureispira anguillae]BDS12932.1 DEAD/DEAH box helicase [Aureispira anguillae]
MTFNDLNINTPLRNALEDLALSEPTPIQVESLPVIMSGRDVVGIAQTGTGKTFAYLLPILRQLKFSKQKHPRVLIVVPTRELVVQVVGEIEKLTAYMSIRTKGAYGGVNMNTQKDELAVGMDILVATPGRLVDLALSRAIKLKTIKQLVIDEVDEMLNLGFRKQLSDILELLPERRQNILFSATLTKEVEGLIAAAFQNPKKIEIAASGTSADGIVQKLYRVPNFNTKINLLKQLLATEKSWAKVLIFAPTKKVADRLFDLLDVDFPEQIGVIHSNKSQNYRLRTVEKFDSGAHRILMATDLIARGLDFQEITHVINFDTPDEAENYIHRVGRTARGKAEGMAITFVSEVAVSQELEYLTAIERLMGQKIPILPLPEGLEISTELMEEEQLKYKQKNAMKDFDLLANSQGAFHEKKLKNTKTNRAQEKRLARKQEKLNSRKRGKK